ncbi:MAG: hypothetical protein AABX55_00830, partial [Nanoarchaeota archaeon]
MRKIFFLSLFIFSIVIYFIFNTANVNSIEPCSLTITTSSLPDGTRGKSYSATISASASAACTAPYVWSVSGSLPPGLNLPYTEGLSATINGIPTLAGSYSFTVFLKSEKVEQGATSKSFRLSINEPPSISISISPTSASL